MTFVKPTSVELYILNWSTMDSVVLSLKRGAALKRWEREAVPMTREGKVCSPYFSKFETDGGKSVCRAIRASDVRKETLFNFIPEFQSDMEHWKRLYSLFAEVMGM